MERMWMRERERERKWSCFVSKCEEENQKRIESFGELHAIFPESLKRKSQGKNIKIRLQQEEEGVMMMQNTFFAVLSFSISWQVLWQCSAQVLSPWTQHVVQVYLCGKRHDQQQQQRRKNWGYLLGIVATTNCWSTTNKVGHHNTRKTLFFFFFFYHLQGSCVSTRFSSASTSSSSSLVSTIVFGELGMSGFRAFWSPIANLGAFVFACFVLASFTLVIDDCS